MHWREAADKAERAEALDHLAEDEHAGEEQGTEFVNPAHVTVSGPYFVTGINKPEALEDRGCSNCGEPNVDGVCTFCWGANEGEYYHILADDN